MEFEVVKKPIIFCHYGNSPYLHYTLKQVILSNPENRIILLGDESNKLIAQKAKVEHHYFQDYCKSEEIIIFDRVYKHIAGVEHKKEFWTKFVFKRWFYIHGFIKKNKINSFWHFDSDNMILSNLNAQEKKFQNFDCTEQCNGMCMNGYISSYQVVNGYVNKINELFKNEEYLKKIKKDFIRHPNFAFTEMRAYKEYKDQERIKSVRLNKIIDNESFDDCICQEHGYEKYKSSLNGQNLKKIFFDTNGNFYFYHIKSSKYIKMNSLNLSWVQVDLFKQVFKTYKSNYRHKNKRKNNNIFILDIFQKESILRRELKFILNFLKRNIKSVLNFF